MKCESASRRFQPGEGPSLLHDYEPSDGPSFQSLICICVVAGDGGAPAAAEEEELRHGAAGDEGAQELQPHQVTRHT